MTSISIFLLFSLLSFAKAQDPAEGWMAYAVGDVPEKYERITSLEMTWKVSQDPPHGRAFYSPWFGMDPNDNLNLIQPVNPWVGDSWAAYTEYFQWSPVHNSNSGQISVEAGQTLHGALTYMESIDAYNCTQTNVDTGVTSSQIVKCQDGKKYRLPYVVYEKTWPCRYYPEDGQVTFNIVKAECDGEDCVDAIKWESKIKDSNCDMEAHVDSNTEIRITWNPQAKSRYDNLTENELYLLNTRNSRGWSQILSETQELH